MSFWVILWFLMGNFFFFSSSFSYPSSLSPFSSLSASKWCCVSFLVIFVFPYERLLISSLLLFALLLLCLPLRHLDTVSRRCCPYERRFFFLFFVFVSFFFVSFFFVFFILSVGGVMFPIELFLCFFTSDFFLISSSFSSPSSLSPSSSFSWYCLCGSIQAISFSSLLLFLLFFFFVSFFFVSFFFFWYCQ